MKLIQLIACSLLAYLTLIASGAYWCIAAMSGVVRLLPFLPRDYPIGDLYDPQNLVLLILLMAPWAALCSWVYWKIEGAWLDYLDPEGARLQASKSN